MMLKKYFTLICLVVNGFLSLALYILLIWQPDPRINIAKFILIYVILFLLYITTIIIIQRQETLKPAFLYIVIIFAVFFRVCLLASTPKLSNDIYRYLWDGKVSSSGINPYSFPPDSPNLKYLQDENFKKIGHYEAFTCYPPLSQMIFMSAYKINPGFYFLKIIFVLFDIGIMLLLLAILKFLKKNVLKIVTYAWNPLVVIEISGNGHLDSFAIFWVILAVFLYYKKKFFLSLFSLALASLAKFFAIPLLFLYGARPLKLSRLLLVLGFAGLFFLPFIWAGSKIFKGLADYLTLWEFNGSVFPLVLYLTKSYTLTKTFIFIFLFIIFLGLFKKNIELPRAIFIMLTTMLVLSPTVYPWYLLWILPFLCVYENAAWLLLSGTIIFSYSILDRVFYLGKWQETIMDKIYVYLPFYSLLLLGCIRKFTARPMFQRDSQKMKGCPHKEIL
ncbi:MAG: hypothetical protein WBI28_00620 [Candidatus Omnitrophota bacterium]